MTKILLVHPISPIKNNSPPLGLAYLGAVLNRIGCQVKIIDGSAVYSSITPAGMVDEIRQFAPDIIGITMTTPFIEFAYQLIKPLSSLNSLIIAGGAHCSLLPEEALENGVEIVVKGEGEETITEIIEFYRGEKKIEEIKGLVYRDKRTDQIKYNSPRPLIENLDEIPYPAKNLFKIEDYVREDKSKINNLGGIIASRGCPGRCTFCSRNIFGNRHRFRSAENIFAEIKQLYDNYRVTDFEFYDDVFTINTRRITNLCKMIIEEKNFNINWKCTTKVNFLNKNLLTIMKKAGCDHINFGI